MWAESSKKPLLVPIIFVVAYLPGLIYAILHSHSFPSGNLITLLTSWFNPTEDWQSFSNVYAGIFFDFIIPLSLFLLAALYTYAVGNSLVRYLSMESIFVNGIIATYIFSGIGWYLTGTSGSGTSILFFSFSIAFIPIILFNISISVLRILKDFKTILHNFLEFAKCILPLVISIIVLVVFLAFSVVSVFGYISEKQFQHFVGFGVFSVITIGQVIDRWLFCKMKKGRERLKT